MKKPDTNERKNLSHRNHTGAGLRLAEAIAAEQLSMNKAAEEATPLAAHDAPAPDLYFSERALFETWVVGETYGALERDGEGYKESCVNDAWRVWKGRASIVAKAETSERPAKLASSPMFELVPTEFVTYAHESKPDGPRFRDLANGKIPTWAVDVKPDFSKQFTGFNQGVDTPEFRALAMNWEMAQDKTDESPELAELINYIEMYCRDCVRGEGLLLDWVIDSTGYRSTGSEEGWLGIAGLKIKQVSNTGDLKADIREAIKSLPRLRPFFGEIKEG